MHDSLIKKREAEVSNFVESILDEYILQFQILVQYFGIVKYSVPVHKLVEYLEYFLFREFILPLLPKVVEGAAWTIFHENVIVIARVALKWLHTY